MPGVVGIVGSATQANDRADALAAMLKCMMHEPFYTAATYTDANVGVWAGVVAHKGSFADRSPVWNQRRDICLLFSGEAFGERSARGDSVKPSHVSDLVPMYEEQGMAFLDRLNGCFCGLLINLRLGEATLFNDRYGLGRMYYCETPNGFFFSSEAKSLLRVLPPARELNPQSLGEFLSCGCALQNRTLYTGMSLLPFASRWTFRAHEPVRKERYFSSKSWESQEPLKDDEYCQKLNETLTAIVPGYLSAGEKIGISLTGGLDSRVLLAARGRGGRKLPCYTFSGMYRECADALLARKVAKACGLPHEVIRVDRGFLAEFSELAGRAVYFSDGAMDVTGSVELYVNRLARGIAPIRVTGNYGSEILRANVAFGPREWGDEVLNPDLRSMIDLAGRTYAEESCGDRRSFIAFKQVPWHHCSRLALERCQLTPRSPFLDNELVALSYRASPEMLASSGPALGFVAHSNPKLAAIPTDRGLTHPAAPAVGRARRLTRAFSIKAENAFDTNMPQWLALLTHVLRPLTFDRAFLGRNRFYHFRRWYGDELAPYVKEVLLDRQTLQRPYLSRSGVEQIVRDHTQGRRNYTFEISKLLSTEMIQRELIQRSWTCDR